MEYRNDSEAEISTFPNRAYWLGCLQYLLWFNP